MARTGTALLPLHGGHVPKWLGVRMERLGTVITEAIVLRYGRDEYLRRLAHPFWFQSFGAVMGMDWHSSGITTSVLHALKRGLEPLSSELGIYVCGGRGKHSRKTPDELLLVGDRTGLDGAKLADASRLTAKVDSAALQDGFDLYLHGFIVAADGKWCVVQQGMNVASKQARRYHWLGEGLTSFVDAPHAAIEGRPQATRVLNAVDVRAEPARSAMVALVNEGPERIVRELARAEAPKVAAYPSGEQLVLPAHHDVRREDVNMKRLGAALLAARERGPRDFADVLRTPGVGARTVFSLALVAEVVHGAPSRFADPARFSLAHGGKDGHPYPVPLKVYDETIRVMKDAVETAKLGNADRLAALERLDDAARRLEHVVEDVAFERLVEDEKRRSPALGGMTVLGPAGALRETVSR
jgi:hypothetical protein